jgi:hypothetical protein
MTAEARLEKNATGGAGAKEVLNLCDEITQLQLLKGSLSVLRNMGIDANDYHALFACQLITAQTLEREIKILTETIESLMARDQSGEKYQ